MELLKFFSAFILIYLLFCSCKDKTNSYEENTDYRKEKLKIVSSCFKYQEFDINLEKFSYGGFCTIIQNNSDKVLKIRFIDKLNQFATCNNAENIYLQSVKFNNLQIVSFNNDDQISLKPKEYFKVDFKFIYLYIDSKQSFEDFLNSFFSNKCSNRNINIPLLLDNKMDTLRISINKNLTFCDFE